MSTSAIIPQLTVIDGRPVATSLNVAEVFHKQHKSVTRAIDRLEIPDEVRRRNFAPSSYINEQGKTQPMFNITRDGFTLLAMGFTGKEAMKFKLAYIEAFNRMEAELIELATGSREKRIDISHTHLRGTMAPGNLDIRYTLDLTKVLMKPNRTGVELLERLTGIQLTDVLPEQQATGETKVAQFMGEELRDIVGGGLRLTEVYERYRHWYGIFEDARLRGCLSLKGFAAALRQYGAVVVKRGGVTVVDGVEFVADCEVRR